jgi:hypothetical protein
MVIRVIQIFFACRTVAKGHVPSAVRELLSVYLPVPSAIKFAGILLANLTVYYSPIMQGFGANRNIASSSVIQQQIVYSASTIVLPPGVNGLNSIQLCALANLSIGMYPV